MAEIVMPRLSDSMEEGTILAWLKQVGDEIAIGEEIVEIETDKANMAYESDVAGTLTEILAREGETLAIGSPIARVGDDYEGSTAQVAGPVAAGGLPAPAVAQASSGMGDHTLPPSEGAVQSSDRFKASPVARRIAKEKGIDLSTVTGSGPGGRIVKKDVKKAAAGEKGEASAALAATTETVPEVVPTAPDASAPTEAGSPETAKGQVTYEEPSKLQATVARRMAESKATAPHFYLQAEIDMSRAVEARARIKEAAGEGEVVPSFNDMVVKACALALREHPRANGAYRDGRFELYSRVNVGIAVAAQDALVVPTIFDADQKGLQQIATDSRVLAQKVRDGKITPPELSGGTFTVSNLGMFGIDNFSAVINAPQAAILAAGAIRERPVVREGQIVPVHIMNVILACDHRILYGAPAAECLSRIRARLEEPLLLSS